MAYLDQMYSGQLKNSDWTSTPRRTNPMDDGSGNYAWASGNQQGAPQVSYGGGPAPAAQRQRGKWQSYGLGYMGDGPVPQDWQDPGQWIADPNVDYGQAPINGAQRTFDQDGYASGWAMNGQNILNKEQYDNMMQNGAATKGWQAPPSVTQHGDYYLVPGQWEGENHLSKKGRLSKYATMAAGATILGAGAAAYAGAGGAAAGAAPEAAGLTASSADVLGGVYGTAGESLVGGELIGQAAGASGGSFLSNVQNYISQGMDVQSAISKAKSLVSTQGQDQGKSGGQSIVDLLGAYYSSQQLKDLSGNLKGMYSDQRGLQNPYNDLLRASYQDPNVFYGSNQWKGLESVYQNKLDRGAAKAGTNANSIDREVKLNNYAMQELEKFRGGLKDVVNAYDPTRLAPIAEKGYNNEAYANTGSFATASRGGSGANVAQTWDTIKNTASTAEDVWNFVSKWF
jgi:hypothetical protein